MKGLFGKPLFPIFGVLFLLGFYFLLDAAVVECRFSGCEKIAVGHAFDLQKNEAGANRFENLKIRLDSTEKALEDKLKITPLEAEQKGHDERVAALKLEIAAIRLEIASRYSYRYVWTFLTAAFLLLSIAAIILSIGIFRESDAVQTTRWIGGTSVAAAVFSGTMLLMPDFYMKILGEIYRYTLFAGQDLPTPLLKLSNAIGFAATIFLVAAVSAVLYSVKEEKSAEETMVSELLNTQKATASGQITAESQKSAEPAAATLALKYETQLQNLRYVLYTGAALLFFALLQLKTLSEWHQAFMPAEANTAIAAVYTKFFTSSLTFQAGIYTVMLGVLYLPAAYVIKGKADALKRLGIINTAQLEEKGLSFNFWEFFPKLLTILTPFLAGPAIDLFKYLTIR